MEYRSLFRGYMKNEQRKPNRNPRPAKVQQKRTETIKYIVEKKFGVPVKNMRGKHFKIERLQLYSAIFKVYAESPLDFHNNSGKFMITWLLKRVESYFDHEKLKRADFYASNEKAIKEEIKNLINNGKINKILER